MPETPFSRQYLCMSSWQLVQSGPSEFHVVGNLKTWDIKTELDKIQVPTLLINSKFDHARDAVTRPFFTGMKNPVS